MECAWCGRENAIYRPLMSKDHPVCKVCYMLWYENGGITPEQLRELSLKQEQEKE